MGLAVTDVEFEGEVVGLRAESGRIVALGPEMRAEPGDEVLDGGGKALVPGLVNGHTHAAMTLFRGYADDLPLMEWLQGYIWPAEAKLEAEDVYWGTRLACLEMIRTGTTRFWDMYWHPEAAARAVNDAGIRATVAAPLIDMDDPRAQRERAIESIDAVGAEAGVRVSVGFAPHAIYTVGPDSLRWVAEAAAERGLTIQIHLSETLQEVEDCVAEHGVRPAELLDRCGMLTPSTALAHGVHLNNAELELIAARGATVVTNPVANLKLAVGGPERAVFDYVGARSAGVACGVGTDGPGSNNSLDLLSDLKTFALLQKHECDDAAAVTAAEALELARGQGSAMLGGTRIAPGAPADFLLVDLSDPGLALGSLDAGLVYSASAGVVSATVVEGRVLMHDGEATADTDEVLARARERARRLLT